MDTTPASKWEFSTGSQIADALVRRAARRTSGTLVALLKFIEQFYQSDPEQLRETAGHFKDEFGETAARVAAFGTLPESAMPDDPAADFRRDLQRRYEELTGYPAKVTPPIELTFDMTFHPAPAARGGVRLTLSFDSHVSLSDATSALREAWKIMRKVHPPKKKPKAVGVRTITLARFVCFQSENLSWAERADEWNAAYPEWAYADGREMYKAFAMAEYALVGTKGSLTYYYDGEWRDIIGTPAAERTPRQQLRYERRMAEHTAESLFGVLSHMDEPEIAALAPQVTHPAEWKLAAASKLCDIVAMNYDTPE